MALRPYQQTAIAQLRQKFSEGIRLVLYQLATGGGKSIVFSEITRLANEKKHRVWIVVPRKKLLKQASDHLIKMKIPHGRINADCKESRAYTVFVVSKDTMLRRIKTGRILNWPKVCVWDECHFSLDQQLLVKEHAPEGTFFVGVTATPKETSGRGLSEMYQDIILGPKFSWLVSGGFLAPPKYFCPPFDYKVKKRGDDYDAKDIEEILASRQVYGKVVSHYRQYLTGKPTLIFCPSVKNSEETAQRFRDAGFRFVSVNGNTPDKEQETVYRALEKGQLDAICSCDLITMGVDLPFVQGIILLRKTMSISLFFQMIGRGTRPFFNKDDFTVLDHMGNFREHATGEGETLEERFDVDWESLFYGTEKNKKPKGEVVASLKLCDSCFMYFSGDSCPNCLMARGKKKDKLYKEIDGRLVEIKGPVKLKDRPEEDQREIQDQIGALIDEHNENIKSGGGMLPGPIGELLKIAEKIGRNPMWVYWRLSEGMQAVNEPLLAEIRRIKDHQPGWIFFQRKEIKRRLGR